MRGFQIWTHNWVWIVFDPYIGRKPSKWTRIVISTVFCCCFLAKIGVKYYPNPILKPYLKSPHQCESFKPTTWKWHYKFIVCLPKVFSKFYPLCANRKSYCWGGGVKLSFVVAHLPKHEISSENMEKVNFVAKWYALMLMLRWLTKLCHPGRLRAPVSQNKWNTVGPTEISISPRLAKSINGRESHLFFSEHFWNYW